MASARIKIVAAAPPVAPQKVVKDIQWLLISLVFFELHASPSKSEKEIHIKAEKYFAQHVANFVNEDEDARSDEGINFLKPDKYSILNASQLMRTKTTGSNFTGKQIWAKAREIRRFVINQIIPTYNSFLQMPGAIFPSGWEIGDILEATRRKMFCDTRTAINLASAEDDDESPTELSFSNEDSSPASDGEFPSTFPSELGKVIIPSDWKPPFWLVFLWFGPPCEYLYGRTPHPQLRLSSGNGPTDTNDEDASVIVKKEGGYSLSRASQKRKAIAETIAENNSAPAQPRSNVDREYDLAERIQKRDESDRVLLLLKENLADAENTPERAEARREIKLHRSRMIDELTNKLI